MSKIVLVKEFEAHKVEPVDDLPAIGSWWWVTAKADENEDAEIAEYENKKYDEPGRKWLACVIDIGSNHVKLEGVRLHTRLSIDDFHKHCEAELDPDAYIAKRVGLYQNNVRELMGEVQRVCALLGVVPKQALNSAPDEANNALAVAHGTEDIKSHKNALVKAKEKTLPDLFKAIEAEHEKMAIWMRAQLVPAKASLSTMKESIGVIDKRIHTVELYAGLTESMEQVRDGEPAPEDTKVRLMQNRLYMDEECLVKYEAGGMNFENIEDFDTWIARADNFKRILPFDRTIVAFRIRRYTKEYKVNSIADFISMMHAVAADKSTFLYIRNGEQLWRMETSIDFGRELFPSKEDEALLSDNDELWISESESRGEMLRTKQQVDSMRIRYQELRRQHDEESKKYKADLKAYKKAKPEWEREHKRLEAIYEAADENTEACQLAGKAVDEHERLRPLSPSQPWFHGSESWKHYKKLTPDHLYYDDAMKQISDAAYKHNRIAVIVQGLLDRSPCLQPHPPWRIWTPEGFALGIELIFDYANTLTPGDPPSFEVYQAQLALSIKEGSITYGQERLWMRDMAEIENERQSKRYDRYRDDREYFKPYGNPGPGKIARVVKVRGGKAYFEWTRKASRATSKKWIESARKGWGHYEKIYGTITETWSCKVTDLFNISAYTPGDFHMFYDDPRTRAGYLKWAPQLLTAEDFHGKKIKVDAEEDDEDEYEDDDDDDDADDEDSDDEDDSDDDDDDSDDDEAGK
jgi:hypothetical protein